MFPGASAVSHPAYPAFTLPSFLQPCLCAAQVVSGAHEEAVAAAQHASETLRTGRVDPDLPGMGEPATGERQALRALWLHAFWCTRWFMCVLEFCCM